MEQRVEGQSRKINCNRWGAANRTYKACLSIEFGNTRITKVLLSLSWPHKHHKYRSYHFSVTPDLRVSRWCNHTCLLVISTSLMFSKKKTPGCISWWCSKSSQELNCMTMGRYSDHHPTTTAAQKSHGALFGTQELHKCFSRNLEWALPFLLEEESRTLIKFHGVVKNHENQRVRSRPQINKWNSPRCKGNMVHWLRGQVKLTSAGSELLDTKTSHLFWSRAMLTRFPSW
jgi:hypothetical protein